MINKIILYSIQHKFIVLLFTAAIIAGGLYSLTTINVDSTPDITNNQVQVITTSENLSTSDIEQFVTYPVESAMANLPGVIDLRSVSRFGLSVVTVVFKDDMGTYLPRQLVQEKLDEVKEQIPQGFGTPEIGPITTGLGEIFQYTLEIDDSSRYTPQQLRTIQDRIVKRQMAMIPGVVEINSFGGSIKQYEISLSSERLNSLKISMSEIFQALSDNNLNTGGAYIEKNHMANFIRGEGLVKSITDIKNIVIKNNNGVPLLIRDVAEDVKIGSQIRYGAFTKDGHEAVGGMILMLKDANSRKVVKAVKDRINSIQKSLPVGIVITPFLDRTNLINRTTNTITRNLTEGALIVFFVLVLLMGSIRAGVITASVIPLALLFAFIMMSVFGVGANLMSLGAIDFGIIVDGAVIIVEGIAYKIESHRRKALSFSGDDINNIAYNSASSVMGSAFFGQLIILVVFTPVLFLSGVSGKMFQPMAYTFSFAVAGAIILCLTYVPAVSALMMRPLRNQKSFRARIERFFEHIGSVLMNALHAFYQPVLNFSLNHKKIVIVSALSLFIIAGLLFYKTGGEFIPSLDEGDIAMQTFLRPGSSLSETVKRETQVEKLLLDNFPEIKTVCARIGVADIPTDPMGFDYTDSFIILEKDMSKWKSASSKEELIQKMKDKLSVLPGLNFSFSQPMELRFNELLTGIREDVAVKIYGDDLDKLNELGQNAVDIISKIKGVGDVSLESTTGLPQIIVKYDLAKIARYGLNVRKLNEYISAAFAGSKAGSFFEGENRFDMVIRLCNNERNSIEDLKNLYVDLPDGRLIPLKETADIFYQSGPMQISHDMASRRIYVGINVRGRDVQSLVDEISDKLDRNLILPPGYRITYGGEFQNFSEAKDRLALVMPVALILIFLLLYFALKSVKQSLMIFMAVPLAAIGGIFALALRNMNFSISAGVGFIVLFGVAVLNGPVLINKFNSLKDKGVDDILQRVKTGTRERLRPILLTAASAMAGFVPMALSSSAGAEVQRPLATVVIGGLFSSTLLTLLVVPVLYVIIESRSFRRKKFKNITVLLIIILISAIPAPSFSQRNISLDEAVAISVNNYPSLKAAGLEVTAQTQLKKSAPDIGSTEFSAGVDEKGKNNDAVTTLILARQNLDILSIAPRRALLNVQSDISRINLNLEQKELILRVSLAYADAYAAINRRCLYDSLLFIYQNFENVAKIRFQTQSTSKIEYLSAQNVARQIDLARLQAIADEKIAVDNFNALLACDSIYLPDNSLSMLLPGIPDSSYVHPELQMAQQNISLAQNSLKVEKSDFYPQFFVEYGLQKIGSVSGYYSCHAGLSFPLFFGATAARTKYAKIQVDIASQEYNLKKTEFDAKRNALETGFQSRKSSLDYYRQIAVPLAIELRQSVIEAYSAGSLGYAEFIQNTDYALQIQLEYWNCLGQYLTMGFNLEYYY